MIYEIGDQKLDVPEMDGKSPRQAVGWRDVAESCRTLDAICRHVPLPVTRAVDIVAKVGFWATVFRNVWPDVKLVLNEEDQAARRILRSNWPDATIRRENPHTWDPPESEVGLFDTDHFTLKILDEWEQPLIRWSSRFNYLIVSDGACFGFKFGNLAHYGVKSPEDYYHMLGQALHRITGLHLTHVSRFENAANVLLGPEKFGPIQFIPPSWMRMTRGGRVHRAGLPPQEGLWG